MKKKPNMKSSMLSGKMPTHKNNEEKKDDNKYVLNKTKKSGKHKHKEISKNRFDRMEKRYKKQSGSGELGSDTSIGQQVISGRGDKSVSRYDEKRGKGIMGKK